MSKMLHYGERFSGAKRESLQHTYHVNLDEVSGHQYCFPPKDSSIKKIACAILLIGLIPRFLVTGLSLPCLGAAIKTQALYRVRRLPYRALWLVAVLLAVLPIAPADASSELRRMISLPDDCAWVVHGGGKATPADRCAAMLSDLQRSFMQSPLKSQCDLWPDLDHAAIGEDMAGRLKFIPLKPGKFLLQAQCSQGAYNESYLIFAYDETRNTSSRAVPALIIFPTNPVFQNEPKLQHWEIEPYEPIIASREIEAKTGRITAYFKGLGDGSIGYYARYSVDPITFRPALKLTIIRDENDHQNGWHFSKSSEPSGQGWQRFTQPPIQGCLASLEKPVCP